MKERTCVSSESGQELVEFALLLPLLLLLLFGIMDFGIAVLKYNTLANVGREIARYGSVRYDEARIESYIQDELGRWTTGLALEREDIEFVLTSGGPLQSTISVTVTHQHRFLTGPVIQAVGGNPDLTLRSVSTMYTEYRE